MTIPLFQPDPAALAALSDPPELLNVAGDYSYMSEGYYQSLEAELAGGRVLPTTADALDAYVVPIALEKAQRAELPIPDYSITLDKLAPPVLAYPINPFSSAGELVLPGDDLKKRLKSMTRTGTYAILCQRLPEDYRLDLLRCVVGRTLNEAYADYARRLFELFGLPLMRVRVIVTPGAYLFSAVEPLPLADLSEDERALLESLGTWRA